MIPSLTANSLKEGTTLELVLDPDTLRAKNWPNLSNQDLTLSPVRLVLEGSVFVSKKVPEGSDINIPTSLPAVTGVTLTVLQQHLTVLCKYSPTAPSCVAQQVVSGSDHLCQLLHLYRQITPWPSWLLFPSVTVREFVQERFMSTRFYFCGARNNICLWCNVTGFKKRKN